MNLKLHLTGTLAVLALASACDAGSSEPGRSTEALKADRAIDPAKELMIVDPSVIASPLETTFDPAHPSGFTRGGAWSFGRLVHNMLPAGQRDSRAAASKLVLSWLGTWERDQRPNPSVSPAKARPSIRTLVTNPWKAQSGCVSPADPATDEGCLLDFTRAPFKLLAIVNRPDLRIVADDGTAIGGEGRFVFQVVGPTLGVSATSGALEVMDEAVIPQKFTVIFEYSLPVRHAADTLRWANAWHELGAKDFGPSFNAALHVLTNGFSGPDQDRRRPNGNAINQVRTNEVALAGARFASPGFVNAKQFWELREFRLTEAGLQPHTMHLEPSRDYDIFRAGYLPPEGSRGEELISYLLGNSAAVLAGKNAFGEMSANSSLVGSAPYGAWGKTVNPNPPSVPAQGGAHALGAVDVAVRDAFALNTCAGCHRHETDTRHFMHVTALGAMEPLSAVDDRTRAGVPPGTPDDATVLSNFLRAEISQGGPRYGDFAELLSMQPNDLRQKRGQRPAH